MNPLIDQLKKYGKLTEAAEEALGKKIKCHHKKKHDHLLKQGQVLSSLFMLGKGSIRAYFIRKEKEVTSWFALENTIMGSILPLYADKASFENIQLLEDSTVYSISISDLNKLYRSYPELNIIGRKLAEELCVILEERIISLHTESAEERYHTLLNQYPGILRRVNLGYIASHLGITQETLSRIRAR